MDQRLKALATKLGNPSSILRIYMVGRENVDPQVIP